MAIAQAMLQIFKSMGFTEFFLPFLLFFAIIYGTLEKTEIFGKERRDINATVALAIALIAAFSGWAVGAVVGFIPYLVFILFLVVGILMAIALVFGNMENFQKQWGWFGKGAIIVISIVLIIAGVYAAFPGISGANINIGLSDQDIAMIILLVVFLAFFVVITRKPSGGSSS